MAREITRAAKGQARGSKQKRRRTVNHEAFSSHPRQCFLCGHWRNGLCRSRADYPICAGRKHPDVELIDGARRKIDFAAYVLTD